VDARTALRQARRLAGLSKRALARRAATSPAAIVMYEAGLREPTVPTLLRLLRAAGFAGQVGLQSLAVHPDPAVNGRRLGEVLDLAERLPHRPGRKRLAFPPLGR
jgi:transcriptional regulator with XRE-family HTH domain